MVKGGTYNETVNHYSLLRTIENMYYLGHAGNAANAADITDCWQTVSIRVNNIANKNNTFNIVPNPASNYISFTSNSLLNAAVNINITDEAGRLAGTFIMSGTELKVNTSAYAAGIYFYKIVNNNNQVVSEG
jgi:hypothetical protein